jgi:WD repeat-containing protein 23
MSAAWSRGTDIARHEYKGLSKMTYALEDWVEKDRQEGLEINKRSMRLAMLRGGHHDPERSDLE